MIVAPGFVDLHTHVFANPKADRGHLDADRIGVQQGVACVVDTGSAGAATVNAFAEQQKNKQTDVLAFCNIAREGLPGLDGGHASRPELCDLAGTVEALNDNNWLVGVKVLASNSHTGMFGLEAVKLARKAAALAGKPLMVHIGNAPPVIDDVLDLMRPGDIVTHTFHGKPGGILDHGDQILPAFRAALERGIHVDVGHGRSSFSFRTFEIAASAGVPLHSISSDLHLANIDRYVVSLARTMTKFRMLGLSLLDCIRAVTVAPSGAIGRSIDENCLTLLREVNEPISLEDAYGDVRQAETQIQTVGIVKNGGYIPVSAAL